MNKTGERRERLWAKDPRCKECGVETLRPKDLILRYGEKHIPLDKQDRMATLEHLLSRVNPLRWKPGKRNETILLCRKCNNARSIVEHNSPRVEPFFLFRGHEAT